MLNSVALKKLKSLGYTLTTAAKPEAKPAVDGSCNKCGHVGPCTDDRGIFRHNRKDGTPCPYSATPASHHAEAKPADVPVVDAVWVEFWGECVYAYTSIEAATKVWQRYLDKGEARIVCIRSVDEEARFLAHHANERLDQHVNRLAEAHARIDALESRLAELEKPAARVVKVPTLRDRVVGPDWAGGFLCAIDEMKQALAAVGVEYKESE